MASVWSPPIHIRAGEKVCIQAMSPMHRSLAFASAIAAAMPSAERSTGRATMRTGIAGAASRAATISCESSATCSSAASPYRSWLPVKNQTSRGSIGFIGRLLRSAGTIMKSS